MKKRNIYYWTLTISAWSAIIIVVVAFISIIAGASIQNIPMKTALVWGVVAIVYHLAVSIFKPEEYKNWETDVNNDDKDSKGD